jgi:lipopolysaccharide biosynthesis glycosyltransferase
MFCEGSYMHIVTASDNNYVPGVFVLIASVIRHNPHARFTVLITDWSDVNMAKMVSFSQRLGVQVDMVEITAEAMAALPITRSHLTRSTYARLFIPTLLTEADRIIYMDCDMVVTGSLREAWECDLGGYILAAARCPTPTHAFARAIDLPSNQYFNAGFLVFSLNAWREEHFAEKCLASVTAPGCAYLSQDESALNDHARGRVNYLPSGFNFYAQTSVWQTALDTPQSIRVIHFITRPKPWNGPCPFGEIWRSEIAKLAEFNDFKPAVESWRSKLTRINRVRKAMMGRFIGKSKYKDYKGIGNFIHKTLVPQYLLTGQFPKNGMERR